jgi:hypothetical protein
VADLRARLLALHARYRDLVFVVAAFLVTRLSLLGLIYFTRELLPERANNRHKDYTAFPASTLWDSFARWDSGWYNRVATSGYFLQGGQSDVAFFPAFPYLARYVGKLLGRDHWVGGLVVTNLATVAGMYFLYKLAQRYLDAPGARRAVWMALAFPTANFFSCFYSEGLFFFAVAGALYFYEEDRLFVAALFGIFAAFTRTTGVLLAPALVFGAVHRRGWRLADLRRVSLRSWAGIGALCLIPLGLVLFMWMLKVQVGDPWAFLKAQATWSRGSSRSPLMALYEETVDLNDPGLHKVWDLFTSVFLIAVSAYALRRLDSGLTIFCLLSVLVPLTSGKVMSMERFATCVVPAFLVLAMWTRRPFVERAVLIGMTMFLALHAVLFADWYWAG